MKSVDLNCDLGESFVVGKVKEGFNSALAKYKEGKQEVVQATEEIVAE